MLVLISLVIIVIAIWLRKRYKYSHWRTNIISLVKHINGPKGLPIIGNLHQIGKSQEESWKKREEFSNKFEDRFILWIFDRCVIHIYNPNDVQKVLASSIQINKGNLYKLLIPWLGTGLLLSKGEKWNHRRKLLTPAYHFNILKQFMPYFIKHSKVLSEYLHKQCGSENDIIPIITQTALELLCETTMGIHINRESKNTIEYKKNIYKVGEMFIERMVKPWYHNDYIFFYLTILGRKYMKTIKQLHSFTKNVIFENLNKNSNKSNNIVNGEKPKMAMLDLLITNLNNGEISFEGVREEVDTFMFEGHDTTTSAIVFTIFCLANNQDCQEKLYKEIMNTVNKNDITYEDLSKLNYLEQCIKEALRLYPSVPIITRKLTQDLQFDNFKVPKNVTINISIYDLHRNKKYWTNPEKFDPERFNSDNSQKRHPFSYVPFSAGLRNCIGQKFAMMVLKVIIFEIIKNFRLEAIDTIETIQLITDLVLRTSSGIKVKFIKRS